jgi:hypothetical protein
MPLTRPRVHGADAAGGAKPGRDVADNDAVAGSETGTSVRVARALECRASVEAVGRAYAVDKGCARVREVEG